jgi:hypothetical protein
MDSEAFLPGPDDMGASPGQNYGIAASAQGARRDQWPDSVGEGVPVEEY